MVPRYTVFCHYLLQTWLWLSAGLLWSSAICAQNEVLDLKDDPALDEGVVLEKNWQFFWRTILKPQTAIELEGKNIPFDLRWHKINYNNETLPPQGYASYRLRFKGLVPAEEGYELATRSIVSSYEAILFPSRDPKELIRWHSGRFGSSPDEAYAFSRPQVVSFYPRDINQEWTLIINVANFEHAYSGINVAPKLARGRSLSTRLYLEHYVGATSAGITLVIAFYNTMIFLRRRSDLASLMLALFCFVTSMRGFSTSFMSAYFFQEQRGIYTLELNMEYLALVLGPVFMGWFLYFSFDRHGSFLLLAGISLCGVGQALIIIISPLAVAANLVGVYQVYLFTSCCYLIYLVYKGYKLMPVIGIWCLAGCAVLMLTTCMDIANSRGLIRTFLFFPYGTSLFVFLQSQVVAQKFSAAYRSESRLRFELELANREVSQLNEELRDHIQNIEQIVAEKTDKIRGLLDHLPLGICTVNQAGQIDKEYSRHLPVLLKTASPAEHNIIPLLLARSTLSKEALSQIQSCLEACVGELPINFQINENLLPTELQIESTDGKKQVLEMTWVPIIYNGQQIQRILVIIRDVTAHIALLVEQSEQKFRLRVISELIEVDHLEFNSFIGTYQQLLQKCLLETAGLSKGDAETQRTFFVGFHTVKGIARGLGLAAISQNIHKFEQDFLIPRNNTEVLTENEVRDSLKYLAQLAEQYTSINKEIFNRDQDAGTVLVPERFFTDLLQLIQTIAGPDPLKAREALKQLQSNVKKIYLDHLPNFIMQLERTNLQLARDLQKPLAKLHVSSEDIPMSHEMSWFLSTVFAHILRNSMDHGIEGSDERLRLNKSRHGNMYLHLIHDAKLLKISFTDDGRGLNLSKILAKAKDMGLATQDLSVQEIAELIFHPSLSTAEKVTEISGRGIGMHALREMIENKGGTIEIELQDDLQSPLRNFRLIICLPIFAAKTEAQLADI